MDSSRGFLLVLVSVLFAASTLIVFPYVEYVLLALVLAYVLAPAQRLFRARMGSRLAAGFLTAAATVAVILPFVVVTRAVAADATELAQELSEGEQVAEVEATVREFTGYDVQLNQIVQSVVSDGGAGALGGLLGVFGVVTHVVIGLGLTLFLLYYFLKDGDDFFAWLRWLLPLPERVQDELYDAIDNITGAVLAGHVLVAIVQGGIAGVGLFVTGIPNALFWTAVMIVLSLLPLVGSFLVWGPAAVYLVTVDRPVAGVLLAVYGTIVVGVSDDYLRPVIVDRYAQVNPSVVILGVLGGLTTMGFIGIFVGPIVIGALRATLDVYREEYDPVVER